MTGPRSRHPDLRAAILAEARRVLEVGGAEGLSLRALADRLDVTAPALYHHFKDKNDLLCALAERGFVELGLAATPSPALLDAPLEARLRSFVSSYVRFAVEHPELYGLLFGRAIWQRGSPTPALRAVTMSTFRKFLEHVTLEIEREGDLASTDVLRVAQATWAMLHGLCCQYVEGVYLDRGSLEPMITEVARFLVARLRLERSPPVKRPANKRRRR